MSASSRRGVPRIGALDWAARRIGGTAVGGELSATLIAGSSGTAFINASNLVLMTASTVILSRILGPGGYGAYAYALTWSLMLASPALLGMPPLMVRKIAEYETRGEWGLVRGLIRRFNQVSLATACLTIGLGTFAGWLLNGGDARIFHPFLVGLLLVPVIAFASLRAAALQGLGRVVTGRLPEALQVAAFITVVGIAYLVLGHNFDATWAVAAYVATAALVLPLGVVLLRRALPVEAKVAHSKFENLGWARSVVPLIVMSVISPLSAEIGIVMLGAMKGAGAVGIFSVANRAASFVGFLFTASMYALVPVIARLHALHDHEHLQRVLTRAARVLSLASIPLAGGLILFSGPILSFFGSGFAGGATPLRILTVAYFLNIVGGLSGSALLMTGQEMALVKGMAIAAVVFIALNAALIPRYGPTGSALATASQVIVTNVICSYLLWRRERLFAPAIGLTRMLS